MYYRHTQRGAMVAIIGLLFGGLAIAALFAWARGGRPVAIVPGTVFAVLFALLAVFSSLTVEVTDTSLQLWFGLGAIRRTFPIADLVDSRAVRNRWWYGWGIRLTPRGWLFNVSGLDAVEIDLKDGRRYRIGTDEPAELQRALMVAMGRTT